jgi:hypothetical protein
LSIRFNEPDEANVLDKPLLTLLEVGKKMGPMDDGVRYGVAVEERGGRDWNLSPTKH